jgi:hypothetical protein
MAFCARVDAQDILGRDILGRTSLPAEPTTSSHSTQIATGLSPVYYSLIRAAHSCSWYQRKSFSLIVSEDTHYPFSWHHLLSPRSAQFRQDMRICLSDRMPLIPTRGHLLPVLALVLFLGNWKSYVSTSQQSDSQKNKTKTTWYLVGLFSSVFPQTTEKGGEAGKKSLPTLFSSTAPLPPSLSY